MEEYVIINTTDRISELPEFIIHHILSNLKSLKDLVRSSVLSKKWFDLTASFPILDFNIIKFLDKSVIPSRIPIDTHHIEYITEKFFKYIDYTTSRLCDQNVSMHTFSLITWIHEPIHVNFIDRCLKLILRKGVKVFAFTILRRVSDESLSTYHLPNILLSASSLESLTMCLCELPSSVLVDAIKFKFLKFFILEHVHIDEEVIKHITTSCPLLEKIKLDGCHGFKRVCIYGLQNLKKVRIHYEHRVEMIDIKAPNLCHLYLDDREGVGAPSMDLVSCENLTKLTFFRYLFPNSKVFSAFLSNFPFLKKLKLHISMTFKDVGELKVIQSPPYELEHVEIELFYTLQELSVAIAVMDVILWCCRTQSLSLIPDCRFMSFEERARVIKLTYEKLLQQEDKGRTHLQIMLSSFSKVKNCFSNLDSLIGALSRDYQRYKITFIKEKAV